MENKQEQLATELEEIAKQLREAKDESAVSLAPKLFALQGMIGGKRQSRSWISLPKRLKKMLAVLLVVAAGVAVTGGWLTYSHTMQQQEQTIVTGVHSLAKLATAEAYVMTTLEGQDNKIFGIDLAVDLPGTKRIYFLVVPAKLLAGVDLEGVTAEDIKIDSIYKKITVELPHATFLDESIEVDKVKVYTDGGIFRSPLSAQEGMSLVSEAQVLEKLRGEAEAMGVLKTAEENAVRTIQGFYAGLGYEVEVRFR